MKRNLLLSAALITLAAFSNSCASNEIGESKDVNQDKIYMNYSISHEEGNENVNVYCTFRFGGENGTTLVLSDGSSVELDGQRLKADSSAGSGAYYKVEKPVSSFYGKHTLRFTNTSGRQYDNEFSFSPFSLANGYAEASKNKDLAVSYLAPGLTKMDYAEVSSSDTDSSFTYSQDGPQTSVVIPAKELKRQKGKSFSLECKLYREADLQQTTAEGGRISIRQELKPVRIKLLD